MTTPTLYDTHTLLGVMRDNDMMMPPSNYWLSLAFGRTVQFTDEYIDFSKLAENRKLAPLVVPTAQGVPIYSAAEKHTRVKPAYVKPKDPVSASRVIHRVAGLGELNSGPAMSPAARYAAIVGDILRQHRRAIERRWEWLAANAVIYAQVVLEDDRYPRTVIDFERNADHDIVLDPGSRWGDNGVSILSMIEGWKRKARRARHGGPLNRITVGIEAWEVMRADEEIRDLIKTDYRPAQQGGLNLNFGVMEGLDVEYVGRLNNTTDVYVYSDYYQTEDGTVEEFMDPRDVVMTGPNIMGIQCFAAIQDINANFAPLAIFPKMWPEQDPSATFVMSQSAPLMVPLNPNASIRARVIG